MHALTHEDWHCTERPILVMKKPDGTSQFSHRSGKASTYENKSPASPCRINKISFQLWKRSWERPEEESKLLLELTFTTTSTEAGFLKYLIEEKGYRQRRYDDFDERDDYSDTTLDGLGDYRDSGDDGNCMSFQIGSHYSYQIPALKKILSLILEFEPSLPFSLYIDMKKNLYLDLEGDMQQCISDVKNSYTEKGFDEAFKKAQEYMKAKLSIPLFHVLAQSCLRVGDIPGVLKAISHETNPDLIYEMAMEVLNAEALFADKDTRLYQTLKILSPACDGIPGIKDFKAQIYAELTGQSLNREAIEHAHRLMRCTTDADRLKLMAEIYRDLMAKVHRASTAYAVSTVARDVITTDVTVTQAPGDEK